MPTDYPFVKRAWLNLLKKEGEKRGIDVDIHYSKQAFIIENSVIGRVRATLEQPTPMNFNVNEERKFLKQGGLENYNHLYTVMLDIHDQRQFDPDIDSFYPLPKRVLQSRRWVKQKPSDGVYLLKINPYKKPIQRWKNDWSKLFNPGSDGDSAGPSSNRDPPSKVAQLQNIAEKYTE